MNSGKILDLGGGNHRMLLSSNIGAMLSPILAKLCTTNFIFLHKRALEKKDVLSYV